MKKMKTVLTALMLCLCVGSTAQTMTFRDYKLAEELQKAYSAAIKDFIVSYPDCPLQVHVVEPTLRYRTPPISRAEAMAIAGTEAVGWKIGYDDYAVGISMTPDGLISLATFALDGTKPYEDREIPRYQLDSSSCAYFVDSLYVVEVNSRDMLSFSYINEVSSSGREYVAVLYDYDKGNVYNAMFYGFDIGQEVPSGESAEVPAEESESGSGLSEEPAEGGQALPETDPVKGYRIEGQCPESLAGRMTSIEQAWVNARITGNTALVPISEATVLTTESIEWWFSSNPDLATATKLHMGIMPPECSLVMTYMQKPKVNGVKYNAALFNIQGFTVVVAQSKISSNYMLVWCEPECRNPETDPYLKSIRFEGKTSSLAMSYTHGTQSYTYRVNLSDKTFNK